jgi:hypothetical protein
MWGWSSQENVFCRYSMKDAVNSMSGGTPVGALIRHLEEKRLSLFGEKLEVRHLWLALTSVT